MKVAVLFSGGKDSTFALSWAQLQGWDVKGLVTMTSSNPDSYMFHTPNIWIVKLQAECLDLPLLFHETPGEKEKELEDLRDALVSAKEQWAIDGLITGAVGSNYQEERINRICHELGIKTYSPLWHKDQEQLVEEMIAAGFDIRIQAIAGDGLTEKFLGAQITPELFLELKKLHKTHGIHVAGEGGEYESLILDGPLFSKRIEVVSAEPQMDTAHSGRWKIIDAKIVEKS